ncbi:MAG: hypothetical protein ACI9P9_000371 [Patescibacteria group bacterium]|jgi:hypothetical protein
MFIYLISGIIEMEKRGQITLFIILAIMIILVIFGVFFWVNRDGVSSGSRNGELSSFEGDLADCVDQNFETAILLSGLFGGHVVNAGDFVDSELGMITIVYDRSSRLLNLRSIENEIAGYLEATLLACVESRSFVNIKISNSEYLVRARDGKVDVSAVITYSMNDDDSGKIVEFDYVTEVPVDLAGLYESAEDIVAMWARDQDNIDITLLAEQRYDVTFIPLGEGFIFIVTDENSLIKETPVSFMFAVK